MDKSRRADEKQLEAEIAGAQADVALFIRARAELEKQARDLGGELSSGGGGPGFRVLEPGEDPDDAKPVVGSITERRAIEGMLDHAQRAADTLSHGKEMLSHITNVAREVRRCVPDSRALLGKPEGCKSCARIKDSKGERYFVPVYRAGSLYCRDCAEFRRFHKTDPPLEVIELRSRGVKVSEERIKKLLTDQADDASSCPRCGKLDKCRHCGKK